MWEIPSTPVSTIPSPSLACSCLFIPMLGFQVNRNKLQTILSLKDFNHKVFVCYSNMYVCLYRMGFVA